VPPLVAQKASQAFFTFALLLCWDCFGSCLSYVSLPELSRFQWNVVSKAVKHFLFCSILAHYSCYLSWTLNLTTTWNRVLIEKQVVIQEFPRHLSNFRFPHHVHKSLSLVSILNKVNPGCSFTPCCFKIYLYAELLEKNSLDSRCRNSWCSLTPVISLHVSAICIPPVTQAALLFCEWWSMYEAIVTIVSSVLCWWCKYGFSLYRQCSLHIPMKKIEQFKDLDYLEARLLVYFFQSIGVQRMLNIWLEWGGAVFFGIQLQFLFCFQCLRIFVKSNSFDMLR
jgi:hypothetical protein